MTEMDRPEDRLEGLIKRMMDLPLRGKPPEGIGLSFPKIVFLGWVARSPGCGVLDIAKGLDLAPPTVSVGVRKLVKEGFLERRRDPNDKRARPLFLTEKGEALSESVMAHQREAMKLFLSGLSPQEQAQLLDLLERAVSSVEDKLGTSPQETG